MSAEHPTHKHFPSSRDLEKFTQEFGIGEFRRVVRDLGGLLNMNELIHTDQGDFVIRVLSGYASSRHMLFEQRMIRTLQQHGIPALSMRMSRRGKPYIRWQGRKVQVSRFHDGSLFQGTRHEIQSSGKMLRKFHLALGQTDGEPRPHWSNYPSFRTMHQGLRELQRMQSVGLERITHVERIYRIIHHRAHHMSHSLPKTILHCDWHPWNCLYDENGDVCMVHDFDFARRGYRVHDIGYALWSIASSPNTRRFAPEFLLGYGPLTSAERAILPWAMAEASVFALTTASLADNPEEHFLFLYNRETPFLEWILSSKHRVVIRNWVK